MAGSIGDDGERGHGSPGSDPAGVVTAMIIQGPCPRSKPAHHRRAALPGITPERLCRPPGVAVGQPISARTAANAATAASRSLRRCAADTCVLIRALPTGTTGKLKPITYMPLSEAGPPSALPARHLRSSPGLSGGPQAKRRGQRSCAGETRRCSRASAPAARRRFPGDRRPSARHRPRWAPANWKRGMAVSAAATGQ